MQTLKADTIYFHELTYGSKGQKMIDIAFDPKSKAWNQKVIFQVCSDSEPLVSPYGLSKPREGEKDTSKRNLDLIVSNTVLVEKFKEIDEHIKEHVFKNSKLLFRKELSRDEVNDRYVSILKLKEKKDNYDEFNYISIKTKCEMKPTPVKIVSGNSISEGSVEEITPGSKVVPIIRLLFIWFMSDKFGVSVQADKYIVFPAPKKSFLDDFILDNEYVVS